MSSLPTSSEAEESAALEEEAEGTLRDVDAPGEAQEGRGAFDEESRVDSTVKVSFLRLGTVTNGVEGITGVEVFPSSVLSPAQLFTLTTHLIEVRSDGCVAEEMGYGFNGRARKIRHGSLMRRVCLGIRSKNESF